MTIKKIIGRFEIGKVLHDSPSQLWENCNGSSGLSKKEFFNYFGDSLKGFALKIENLELFDPVDPYEKLEKFVPPQSYCYINPEDWL